MPPQSSSSEELLMANGMSLRTKRNKNVGAPDMKRGRRPNGEAATQKQSKAQKKVDDREQQEGSLRKVAQVEHRIANKENNNVLPMPVRLKGARSTVVHPSLSDNSCVPDSEEERERQREKRKEKRKARTFIDGERAILDVGNAPSKLKRKADKAVAEPSVKKLKVRKNAPGGLRPDWSMGNHVPRQAMIADHSNDQDSDREPIGGISDDEDVTTERAALDTLGFKSLAKVNLSPVIPVPQVSARRQYTLKKKKITRSDVPHGIRRQFHDEYVPYAIRLAGRKEAWYTPNHEDAINAWNSVLTSHAQPTDELGFIAEKLINDNISHIRNRMKEAAVKALDKLLKDEGKITIEEKAQYVKWLEGNGLGDNKPPFYYKTVDEHGNRKGVFQSYLIAATYSLHLAAISGLRPHPDRKLVIQHPGALVMAVQAVKRALFYYRNGIKEEPNPRDPLSHFSHANWADREETRVDEWGDTIRKIVPLTSSISVLVEKLQDWQWEKIHKESIQFLSKGPPESPSPASSCQYNEDPELVDDDDDFRDVSANFGGDGHSTELAADICDDNIEETPDCDDNHSNLPGDDIMQEYSQDIQDDLLNFNDGDIYMQPEDDDEESVTESDTEMPSVARPRVKWVGYYGDSDFESD